MQALGDPHNFGKRVSLASEAEIYKPRTLFWERLFLSSKSPLRTTVDDLFLRTKARSPFLSVPQLNFSVESADDGGKVERIALQPFSGKDLTESFCDSVGRCLALLTALGIADLHQENIGLGISSDGQSIFMPLDIESAFENYTLPSQTHILPSTNVVPELCGLSNFVRLLNTEFDFERVLALCLGYLECLQVLIENDRVLSESIFAIEGLDRTPVRLFLRSTREYFGLLHNKAAPIEPPLFSSELEQLERGDIPYFFRFLSSHEILYYSAPGKFTHSDISGRLAERALANSPLYQIKENPLIFSESRNMGDLTKAGVLQILRFLSAKAEPGMYQVRNLRCEINSHELSLIWGEKLKIKCKRE